MSSPSKGGRPFATLSLLPFLWLEQSDASKLHSIYLKLSLKFHPDRIPPEKKNHTEYVEEMESLYSQINADYQDLKSLDRRIERILNEQLPNNQHSNENRKAHLPPDLALEYFEVTENPTLELLSEFENKVRQHILENDEAILKAVKKYPYSGEGSFSTYPWSPQELTELKNLQSQKKYLSNILSEIAATRSRL